MFDLFRAAGFVLAAERTEIMRTVLFVGCLCLLVSVGFLVAGCGSGESKAQAGPQTTCPMMGTPIDKKVFVDYKGKRVYFCCDDCPKVFKDDAAAQIKKMTDAGVILEDTPK